MTRKRPLSVYFRDQELLKLIEPLKQGHPLWGYRRVWAYLTYRKNISVGKHRVYRVMKEHSLLTSQIKKKAPRRITKPKLKTQEPLRVWGIDMTKVALSGFGWAYLVVVLDWASKKIVGHSLSHQSKTSDWLDALDKAINESFSYGVRDSGLKLVSDHGSQPTSMGFMKAAASLGIEQVFTSYCNPKGNADTERVIRTLKEDLVWPNEFETLTELSSALDSWVKNYNEDYPHSSLGYQTPAEYEENYQAQYLHFSA